MKIVIAPDSFKDGLEAQVVAQTIFKAFNKINSKNQYDIIPISDGGEGILASLTKEKEKVIVTGPLGKPLKGYIGFLNNKKTIIVEMALAAGLEKVKPNKRNPLYTTTYGVGELILKALEYNPEKIILGLGGSSTNDLGIGALQALGMKFYNSNNIETGIYGKDIFEIEEVDSSKMDKRLLKVELLLATDVNNPLLGISGATYIFGPQKGLEEHDLKKFDNQFKKVSSLLNKEFNSDFTTIEGSGAAGGLAYAIATVFNGKITSGFDVVYEELNLQDKLKQADILITGEGKIDNQTLSGKGPFQIVKRAREINPNITVYAFAGTNEISDDKVFNKIIEINDKSLSLEENLKRTKTHLFKKSLDLAKKIL